MAARKNRNSRIHSDIRHSIILVLAMCLAPAVSAQHHEHGTGVPLYDNLGNHHYEISTDVPETQQYFDQGLRLYYAFNHMEAIRAFNEAARLDPKCAICHWGTAMSLGPNINLPMDSASSVAAYEALQLAQASVEYANPAERALIEALAHRYAPVPPEDRTPLDTAFAMAMKDVVAQYPGNLEARALYAESLMDLSPWQYWEKDGSARPDTPEILAQLEHVIAASPSHPGANHFYIHAVEAVDPQRAVTAAEALAGLMPGAGHLVHMPGHIYIRVGRYEDAIKVNEHAVHADESYISDQNPAFGVYVAGYYPHNYDFLAFAASMIGRSEQTVSATEKMNAIVPTDMLRVPGMTFLQGHSTRHLQMKVRFGRWADILATPAPPEDLPHAHGIWHYATGRARAATGDVAGAEAELEALRTIASNPELMDLRMEFNSSGAIVNIAVHVLAGHVAAAKHDYASAEDHLRAAADLEDNLVYGEPPEWSVPVRQELGSVLLAAGHHAEAEAVFQQDLNRFPDNGWSLHGLAGTLRAQGREAEADEVMDRFETMWAGADVEL
ncbi:MAG TPA: hypothetical protein VMO47_14090 [Rhodothermales bacterium]|nr:hypothetical protein [Rhodothermales bacterium]